jgi:methionine biosynthesis protein MetW
MSTYGDLVAAHGLSHSHRLILEAVPPGSRVLDVGCATGYMARLLGERGCTVIGVESQAEAAAQARDSCETVIEGDIEDPATRRVLPAPFEVVIFADVLEHLRDPWETLAFARALLADGGRALVSVPNIGHWTARRALVRGRFRYAEHGLFDRTHLRFFTRESASELARRAGFEVAEERFATAPLPLEYVYRRYAGGTEQAPPPLAARLRERSTRSWPELFALQFVLTLTPARLAP